MDLILVLGGERRRIRRGEEISMFEAFGFMGLGILRESSLEGLEAILKCTRNAANEGDERLDHSLK